MGTYVTFNRLRSEVGESKYHTNCGSCPAPTTKLENLDPSILRKFCLIIFVGISAAKCYLFRFCYEDLGATIGWLLLVVYGLSLRRVRVYPNIYKSEMLPP